MTGRLPRAALAALLLSTPMALAQRAAMADAPDYLADNPPNALQQWFNSIKPGQSSGEAATVSAADVARLTPKMATQEQALKLFRKGTVTGEELKAELEAVRFAARETKTQDALAAWVGQASAQLATAKNQGLFSDVGDRVKDLVTGLVRQNALSYSDKAVTDFIKTLADDDEALRKETIDLPTSAAAKMNLSEQQSVLVMAALVIGARIAHRILDAAQHDFAGLEGEYAALLNKREVQAQLLADALDKPRQAKSAGDAPTAQRLDGDLGKWLSSDDLKFADGFGANQPLHDFGNDLGMQNLGIKYLQHTNPSGYASYRADEKRLTGRARAYLRLTTGVAAFGAFSVGFVQEIVKAAHDKNMFQLFSSLPFAGEYVKEAAPLIKLSVSALYTGLIDEPKSLHRHYRLIQQDKTTDVSDARAVFSALEKSNNLRYFTDALFRGQPPGLIYQVYQCDPGAAGALIDSSVKQERRNAFAQDYLQLSDVGRFSFADALTDDLQTPRSQRLSEVMLSKDQRMNPDVAEVGEIQRLTEAGYAKWKTMDLTKLVLANSQGVYAQMQVGDTLIRFVPSMATIYTYDSYADHCGHAAGDDSNKPGKSGKPKAKAKTGS